jgi:hypothetical protein
VNLIIMAHLLESRSQLFYHLNHCHGILLFEQVGLKFHHYQCFNGLGILGSGRILLFIEFKFLQFMCQQFMLGCLS